jgi:hypothetical protein
MEHYALRTSPFASTKIVRAARELILLSMRKQTRNKLLNLESYNSSHYKSGGSVTRQKFTGLTKSGG